MNKNMVLLLAVGGVGAVGLFFFKKMGAGAGGGQIGTKPPNTVGSANLGNANQPWYAGNPSQLIQGAVNQVKANPTAALAQASSAVTSLTNIWGDATKWFSGTGTGPDATGTNFDNTDAVIAQDNAEFAAQDPNTIQSTDSLPVTADSLPPLADSGSDPSNIFGDQSLALDSSFTSSDPFASLDTSTDVGSIGGDNSDFSMTA